MIKISRKVTNGEELVIIPKKEYDNYKKKLKELSIALKKIRKGEMELKNGKTITDKRLKDFI